MNTSIEFQATNIKFLEFELNNQCQYAQLHSWCPRNRLGTVPLEQLSTDVIGRVMKYFSGFRFNGTVYFSIYNEPLLDARIFDLISFAKAILPKCTVQMYTNGLLLTPDTAERLVKSGLDILRISHYSDSFDYSKVLSRLHSVGFRRITISDRLNLMPKTDMGYDDRIQLYDRDLRCHEPCYMPIQYFNINCRGDVMLCWDEWKSSVTFGNVYTDDLSSILLSDRRLNILEELKKGNRDGVCRGCDRPTEMCISEYRSQLKL